MVAGYIICLLVGLLIGALVTCLIFRIKKRTIGTLRVDQSDPDDEPYLFLELTSNVDTIKRHKHVTFRVNVENYLSQK